VAHAAAAAAAAALRHQQLSTVAVMETTATLQCLAIKIDARASNIAKRRAPAVHPGRSSEWRTRTLLSPRHHGCKPEPRSDTAFSTLSQVIPAGLQSRLLIIKPRSFSRFV